MRHVIACALPALAVLAAVAGVLYAAPGEGGAGFKAQVVALQVAAPLEDTDIMFRPVNSEAGVSLSVVLRSTGTTIVDFDNDQCQLGLLQDDKGTDLKGDAFYGPHFVTTPTPTMSKQSKAVLFDVRGGGVPAPGATRIKLECTAVLKVATTLDTARQENVALKEGSQITVGPVPLTIKDVQAQGAAMAVTLAADQGLDAVNEIKFQDAAGAEIPTQDIGWSTSTMMGKVSAEKQVRFEKKVDSATVVIKYWKDLETRQVPLKLEAGLSLQ